MGIIPAYAGNTAATSTTAEACRDHPRVCGEHMMSHGIIGGMGGSSPRMRGTPILGGEPYSKWRIIPAYAGNTSTAGLCRCSARDHPRVCGEHPTRTEPTSTSWGSSPRMRGTHRWRMLSRSHCGIIPAYAGNTSANSSSASTKRDHPRVCGEHPSTVFVSAAGMGSSPRMRGTPGDGFAGFFRHGIIPAYAGNTCRASNTKCIFWDHPRVCGEHHGKEERIDFNRGSSPRMRGTQNYKQIAKEAGGIIPAYAGNTWKR